MPDLVLEVCSLEATLNGQTLCQLFPEKDSCNQFVPSMRCELAPAWDVHSMCFATDAVPLNEEGKAVWHCHEEEEEKTCDEAVSNEVLSRLPEPLVALLVSVPPPGGLPKLAAQNLRVTVFAELFPAQLATQCADIPLRQLITAGEKQIVQIASSTSDAWVQIVICLAWLSAPPGIQQLLNMPSTTLAQDPSIPTHVHDTDFSKTSTNNDIGKVTLMNSSEMEARLSWLGPGAALKGAEESLNILGVRAASQSRTSKYEENQNSRG